MELYRKYRPQSFKEIVGQKEAIAPLIDMGKKGNLPHVILFSGPSGTGKTTIARILRKKLKCADVDFIETNAADFRGIDTIREIRSQVNSAPLSSPCRIWLIDEIHQMTGAAQDSFLKLLEDTPSHVYFFLATTDPQKLKRTIITRATHVVCKPISNDSLSELVKEVHQKEAEAAIEDELLEKIVEASDGSARQALVFLNSIIGLDSTEQKIEAIEKANIRKQGIEIARALLNPKVKWKEVAGIIKTVEDDPEKVRWIVLGYCKSVLLNGGGATATRAHLILEEFRDNFYDTKQAGLVLACYNVVAS